MKTVKEVSKLTGTSIRTLHYYDEIGILRPTIVNHTGYRYYDENALERLKEILLLREFNISLKDIKSILDNPNLNREQRLRNQREMLMLQKVRIEKIILAMDDMLEGGNIMDLELFNKSDIETLYQGVIRNITDESKEILIKEYHSIDEFKEHFFESSSNEVGKRNLDKLVEWYGDKESAMEVGMNENNPNIMAEYGQKLNDVLHKFVDYIGMDVASDEVVKLLIEYDFISKQLYQMKDVSVFSLDTANEY